METILSDYVSTNVYRKEENERMIEFMTKEQGMDEEMARQITDAHPDYLQATFNAITRKYGSIDAFLYLEFGLGEEARHVLREKFLQ